MAVSADSLSRFYQTPLGRELARACAAGFGHYAPPAAGDIALGFGYTLPYLARFTAAARECLSFMPANMADPQMQAEQAAETENSRGEPLSPAAEKARLRADAAESVALLEQGRKFPLEDSSIDCILAVHALEFCPDPAAQLNEFRRILAANGRLILAVPNRRGLWARAEYLPFGHGQPYSRSQLAEALTRAQFSFSAIQDIGHFLPQKKRGFGLAARLYSKAAQHFFPYFGAVLMVEARKQLYRPVIEPGKRARAIFMPDFSPQPAGLAAPRHSRRRPPLCGN